MAFIDKRFPLEISYGASGGAGWSTGVVVMDSGFEQRNQNWQDSRYAFDVSHGVKTQAQLDALIIFFRLMKGRANYFRFKDWADFDCSVTEGVFATIDSTHFQMQKRYMNGSDQDLRTITHPVTGTIAVTGGTGISIDYSTGIVTVTSGTPTSWTGEFDIPCRFDTDQMKVSIDDINIFSWGGIPVVEVRV